MRCWWQGACECRRTESRSAVPVERSTVLAGSCDGGSDVSWFLDRLSVPRSLGQVAIKLNLCDYRLGDSGATTSLELLQSVVDALRDHCPDLKRVVLVEQDSSGTRAKQLFHVLGFDRWASDFGCELFDPDTAEWRTVDRVGGLELSLPEVVYDVDLFVNLPKVKLHGRTAYTGALKNNFGLVKRKWKASYHSRLCEAIVASNRHLPRQLVFADGLVTLAGRGPTFGIPVRSDIVLASWDPVAVDRVGARLLGIPWMFLSHIEQAAHEDLGSSRPWVEWRSPSDTEFKRPEFDWLRFLATNALRRG